MGEYERAEEVGADIERTANTMDPVQPKIGKEPIEAADRSEDDLSEEDSDFA